MVVGVATLVTKVISLLREWLMAAFFGTSLEADSWLMASVIPNRLFAAIDSGLSNVLVPTLSGAEARFGQAEIDRFIRESMTLVSVVALALTAVGYAFTVPLVHLIAPSFHGQKLALTLAMTRIMLPTILLWTLNGYLSGVLRAREAFSASSTAGVITGVLRVVTLLILAVGLGLGIRGVAIGFTLSVFAQTVYLIWAVHRHGIRLGVRIGIGHPLTRRLARLSPPFLLSSSVTTIGVLVDRILASGLVTGSIAALNYSSVLSQLPGAVLLQSFAQPVFTRLAQQWNQSRRDEFQDLLSRGFILVAAVGFPVAIVFLLLPGPILAALFEHGRFTAHSRRLTEIPLMFWAIGVPAASFGTYLSRALFAQQRIRVTMTVSLITVACNIAGDLVLIHPLKAGGLALATSLAWWIRASLLAWFLRRGAPASFIQRRPLLLLAIALLVFVALLRGLPPVLALGVEEHGLIALAKLALVLVVAGGVYGFLLIRLPILDPRDRQRFLRKLRQVSPS